MFKSILSFVNTGASKMKKIAIIGAGWTGLGCLRVLREYHQVDVYEQKNDIGGTWHPDNCYSRLKIHTPAMTIEYSDFPFPRHIDRFERITSSQVFFYLRDYCTYHNLYQHIAFNHSAKKIFYNTLSRKSRILLTEKWKNEHFSRI